MFEYYFFLFNFFFFKWYIFYKLEKEKDFFFQDKYFEVRNI
jgi:hypothetical protein